MARILGADKHRRFRASTITADQLAGDDEHVEQVPIGTIHAVDPATGMAACGVEPRHTFPTMTWPPGGMDFATPCRECTRRMAR
ncbi:MAG: hypothetical protein WKF43_07725 [Acidimicrobiales bacterium]